MLYNHCAVDLDCTLITWWRPFSKLQNTH